VYRPEAPQTLPPTPFWTAETQFCADFGFRTDIRCSFGPGADGTNIQSTEARFNRQK
jgi:hypothetical protein